MPGAPAVAPRALRALAVAAVPPALALAAHAGARGAPSEVLFRADAAGVLAAAFVGAFARGRASVVAALVVAPVVLAALHVVLAGRGDGATSLAALAAATDLGERKSR